MRSLFLSLCLALPVLGALSASACSSDDSSAVAGGACTKSSDCGGGQVCGYSGADKCTAVGKCIASDPFPFDGCGCDGITPVTIVSPGYGATPVSSTDPCVTDAGPKDSGPTTEDAGVDASTDAALESAAPSEAGTDAGSDASVVDSSTDAPATTDASDASHD